MTMFEKEAKRDRVSTMKKEAKSERLGGKDNYYASYRSLIRLSLSYNQA